MSVKWKTDGNWYDAKILSRASSSSKGTMMYKVRFIEDNIKQNTAAANICLRSKMPPAPRKERGKSGEGLETDLAKA